ncbi:MAG: hypothetical protein ACREJG_09055 [Candidatus Rokuibacteriota bacterium]
MARRLLALAFLLLTSPAAAEMVYDFEWRAFSRLSRAAGTESVTTGGEIAGRATLWLTRGPKDEVSFTWSGPQGSGHGRVEAGALMDLSFPTTIFPGGVPADVPPAPPHLVGGSWEPVGEPDAPLAFDIRYADGFLCRAEPAMCGGVNSWERHFDGRAVRRSPRRRARVTGGDPRRCGRRPARW